MFVAVELSMLRVLAQLVHAICILLLHGAVSHHGTRYHDVEVVLWLPLPHPKLVIRRVHWKPPQTPPRALGILNPVVCMDSPFNIVTV